MGVKPLTREFEACLEVLLAMCREASSAIEGYIETHPMGHLQHAAAEAALWCRNLKRDLKLNFLDNTEVTRGVGDCQGYLQDLLDRADRLQALVENLREHKGDYRLIAALGLLTESLRLTTPPVLRWCHGYRPGEADGVLREKQRRFHALISGLVDATAAA